MFEFHHNESYPIFFIQVKAQATQSICEICICSVTDQMVGCIGENLFKLFDAEKWNEFKTNNNSAALTNVKYVFV